MLIPLRHVVNGFQRSAAGRPPDRTCAGAIFKTSFSEKSSAERYSIAGYVYHGIEFPSASAQRSSTHDLKIPVIAYQIAASPENFVNLLWRDTIHPSIPDRDLSESEERCRQEVSY